MRATAVKPMNCGATRFWKIGRKSSTCFVPVSPMAPSFARVRTKKVEPRFSISIDSMIIGVLNCGTA